MLQGLGTGALETDDSLASRAVDKGYDQINIVPIIGAGIGAAACVANHISQLRVLERACGDAGVKRLRTGMCGAFGSVECNEPPPPPDPDNWAFWFSSSMQMMWSPPFDWGWPNHMSGPFIITDGF